MKKAVVLLYCAVLLIALALCAHAAFVSPPSDPPPASIAAAEQI